MRRPKAMDLSPELDLLERLTGSPMPLETAVRLFPDEERARHVVGLYVRSGFVRLFRSDGDCEQPVREWELRTLLAPAREVSSDLSDYRLVLTDEGHRRFVDDSGGFYDRLFGR